MDDATLLSIFDREQRREVIYPDARRDVVDGIVRHVSILDPARGGWIIYGDYDHLPLESLVVAQVAYFSPFSEEFEWKLYEHDTPTELRVLLEKHGFVPEEPETVVVLDLNDSPDWISHDSAHEVRELTRPEELDEVQTIEEAVWHEDFGRLTQALGMELRMNRRDLNIYVATIDGAPASTAWIRYHEGSQFASLWGGSTIESYRGMGLYTALLAVRAREAQARGFRFLTVDASDMSCPILVKHGFRVLTRAQAYMWRRPAAAAEATMPASQAP